jgi:hypothetical protein
MLRIKVNRTINCKLLSLTLRGEYILQVSENKVLRKIFGSKKNEVKNFEYYITRNVIIYKGHLVLSEQQNVGEYEIARIGKRTATKFWWGNLLKNGHLQDSRRWESNIKMDFREVDCKDGRWMELA